jgi:DNA-binding transcriptional MerR regulator
VISILATIAKQERLRISERVKAGLDRARNRGRRLGRPKKFVDAHRIAVLRDSGLSWEKIAEQLEWEKEPLGGWLVCPPKTHRKHTAKSFSTRGRLILTRQKQVPHVRQ